MYPKYLIHGTFPKMYGLVSTQSSNSALIFELGSSSCTETNGAGRQAEKGPLYEAKAQEDLLVLAYIFTHVALCVCFESAPFVCVFTKVRILILPVDSSTMLRLVVNRFSNSEFMLV